VPQFSGILALAEQRMYYGGSSVAPLRIREMESTTTLTFVDGQSNLPDGYLDKRALYWRGAQTVSVSYEPPSVFYPAEADRAGFPYPLAYTIEGNTIILPGKTAGTGQLLHYAKAEALEGEADTNDILATFPGVYLYGCQVEVFRHTRDVDEEAKSLRRYADAVDAANRYTMISRSVGSPLKRKIGFGV
jgi:hypothetical protein